MHRIRFIMRLLMVVGLWVGMGGSALAEDSTPAATTDPTVFVRTDPAVGTILTDPMGRTLYLFTKDVAPNASVCTDDCLTNWPAFTAEEPLTLPNGVDGELTSFQRADGSSQVAFNGIPLYYFAGDSGPGDVNGQAKGDVWFVVTPGQQFGAMATPPAMMMGGTPAAESTTIDVSLQEFTIMASQTTFKVGVEYTFNVTNNGQYQHEFVIEKAGANDEPLETDGGEAEIEPFDGGTTNTLTFTFTEAGNYQFACHVMTHYSMGMALTIHVTE